MSYLPEQMRLHVRPCKLTWKDYEMLLLKTCPRCREGDVVVDRDIYGWNALCLQCGFMADLTGPSDADRVLEGCGESHRVPVAQPA